MNIKKIKIMIMTIALIAMLTTTVYSFEGPMGAQSADEIRSERIDSENYAPTMVPALAGNLTQLNITGITQTKSWQGFFGNVSGTIVLEDSIGHRFYDWTATEPQGQVYASINDTISWSNVQCAPIATDVAYREFWTEFYGMAETEYDDINNTYILNDHPAFDVGYTNILQDSCRSTYTFVNNESQTGLFPSVLLTSDDDSTLIFTAILEDKTEGARTSIQGYDGNFYDFQLLVAEDGRTNANSDTTPYYFWVEIY